MRKIISIVLSFGLLFQQSGLLYAAGEINLANYLSQAKSAIVQPDIFQPARLRYISYDIANNDFKILLDKGNNVNQETEKPKNEKTVEFLNSPTPKLLNSQTPELNESTRELFNYFLIGLALPNDTFWVNLRPDAPENIIDPILEKTDIGKIFLEADLQLKKDTASLTSPQNPEGKAYWDKLYKKAGELFGTENITIPTITRPWIVPNEVIVRETEDSAYIYKATLKVMLESDYLNGRGGSRTAPTPDQYVFSDPRLKELNEYSTQLIRETIIPKLTKEVNSSKRYAQLRQVYYSLVLSRWFKQKYSSLGSISAPEPQSIGASANNYIGLIDSGNLAKLASQESCDKQSYFQAYQKSFKDGEYNLKETVTTSFGQSIRSYISGGINVVGDPKMPGNFNMQAENTKVTETLTGFSASPVIWEKLLQDGPDSLRYVELDSLSGSRKENLLRKIEESFPVFFNYGVTTDYAKCGFAVEVNESGGIVKVVGAWRYYIAPATYVLPSYLSSSYERSVIDRIKPVLLLKMNRKLEVIKEAMASGSPVVGEKLAVLDENGKVIGYLRFVSYDKDIKGKNRVMLKDIMDKLNGTAFLSSDGGAVYHSTLDSSNLSGMYFAVELDGSGRVIDLKGILRIVNGKRETLGGKNQEVINALKNKEKEIVSSAVVSGQVGKLGGIDLTDRALHIKLERVGSFASTSLLLPQVKNTQDLDLDKEFAQVEALASSGIVPNSRRLLELFTVCHYRGEFGERLNQIISCLKASSAIQEAQAIDSDEDFRLALMMPEMLS